VRLKNHVPKTPVGRKSLSDTLFKFNLSFII
jgi:hypothetical protein